MSGLFAFAFHSVHCSRMERPILFLFVHNEKNQTPISIHLGSPSGLMNLIRAGDRRKLQFAVAVFSFFRLCCQRCVQRGVVLLTDLAGEAGTDRGKALMILGGWKEFVGGEWAILSGSGLELGMTGADLNVWSIAKK